jgi:hypothetical protein
MSEEHIVSDISNLEELFIFFKTLTDVIAIFI